MWLYLILINTLFIAKKRADYLLFEQGIELLYLKARSNIEGIREIVSIKASLNWGLSDTLRTQFPTVQPVPRPIVDFEGISDPNWLAGFVDGEGYFYVKVQKAETPSGFYAILYNSTCKRWAFIS